MNFYYLKIFMVPKCFKKKVAMQVTGKYTFGAEVMGSTRFFWLLWNLWIQNQFIGSVFENYSS